MILLVSTSDVIQAVTSAACTLDAHASYANYDPAQSANDRVTLGRENNKITTAATTNVVDAPGSGISRKLKLLTLRNRHATTSVGVVVKHTDGTIDVELFSATLMAGEVLQYTEDEGFRLFDDTGALKPGGALEPKTNDFRLTGVSGTPVMTADSTTLSNLFLARYRGANICLYDGVRWNRYAPVEPTIAVTGRTTDLPFDVFAFADSAGAVQLELLNWTNSTTRATGITRQDGVWTKTGDPTRRLVGSVRARSATTYHWVLTGVDLPVKMDLWNADNQVDVSFTLRAGVNTWAYTIATWRQAQGSANYQVDVMVGLQEDWFIADLLVTSRNSTISIARNVGIGYDSTTAFTGNTSATTNEVASIDCDQNARIAHQPAIGVHRYTWLEISTATGVCTWVGDDGALRIQSGMSGQWTC